MQEKEQPEVIAHDLPNPILKCTIERPNSVALKLSCIGDDNNQCSHHLLTHKFPSLASQAVSVSCKEIEAMHHEYSIGYAIEHCNEVTPLSTKLNFRPAVDVTEMIERYGPPNKTFKGIPLRWHPQIYFPKILFKQAPVFHHLRNIQLVFDFKLAQWGQSTANSMQNNRDISPQP